MFKQHHRIGSVSLAALVLALTGLGIAACGGSSTSTSTSANAAATGAGNGSGAQGSGAPGSPSHGGAGRFTAVRECLQKSGITLPQRPAGGATGASGQQGFLGGAGHHFQLPPGVSRTQLEAAMKKCDVHGFPGQGGPSGRPGLANPVFRVNLTKFAACMRENGIPLSAPNTSGTGSVFNTQGIDTHSSKFMAAFAKCRSVLRPDATPGATGTTGAG